jgi:uncharacterized protein (TIGR02270 family)
MVTIEEEIYEEHARQAAFLWLLRDNAARDAAYDLADLAELDERLEAHLDGLRLAGDGGWEACKALLEDPEGGEVFGAAIVAVERWDLKGVARVLDTFGGVPDLGRGFVSALGWTPFEKVQHLLPGLLSGRCPPALQWLGISACAVHRKDPGPALGYAILSNDGPLTARALRAAGELGKVGLLNETTRGFIRSRPRHGTSACPLLQRRRSAIRRSSRGSSNACSPRKPRDLRGEAVGQVSAGISGRPDGESGRRGGWPHMRSE